MLKRLLTFSIITLALVSSSCEKDTRPQEQSNEVNPITISAAAANSLTDFSFDFFKKLQEDKEIKTAKNIFVSPLSLHMALAMLVNGAEESTKTQMLEAMKATSLGLNELNEAHKKLLKELPEADRKVILALANSIWYKNTFEVKNTFLADVKNFYNAKVTALPFVEEDLATINQWASDNTNGKIPKVLSEIHPDHVMFLMNALYFKGDWKNEFKPGDTKDEAFMCDNGTRKTVKMMNMKDTMHYANFDKYEIAQKSYGNSQFIASFILPKSGNTLSDVFSDMTTDKWKDVLNKTRRYEVNFGLPKFTFSGEYMLNNTLKRMGITDAFEEHKANFNNLSSARTRIKIDFVKQNTYVGIDEKGTEAAAVTTIGMIITSMPQIVEFKCNKPFGIIISERTSGTILFMGKIMNP